MTSYFGIGWSDNFMQNVMQIMVMWSKSKPEVKFPYHVLFLQNRNGYISAVDWVILKIFGTLIDSDLLKKWRHTMRCGSKIAPHLPPSFKSIRRHISAVSDPILVKYGWRRMTWQLITAMRSKSKLKRWHEGLKAKNCSLVVCKSGML